MAENLTNWLSTHYGKEQYAPGLARISKALHTVLPSFKDTKIITVAGTNGKGETVLRLSSHLKQCPHCVWTSPHVVRLTERFRSEVGEIETEELKHLIHECHEKVQSGGLKLTYYEFLFFVFCTWASQRSPQFLLLEVGLGGRFDAVNVFDADLLLLPSISRDHQEFLGNRYDLILEEKLGVLRPLSTLITNFSLKYLRQIAQKKARQMGLQMIDLADLRPLPAHEFSKRNQLLAYAAYLWLFKNSMNGIDELIFDDEGLEHRGEILKKGADWILFGSHNVDGLRKLIQFLRSGNYNFSRPPFDIIIIGLSQRSTVDLQVMLRMLKRMDLGRVIVTSFNHPKAATRPLIEDLTRQEGLEFVADIDSYVQGKDQGHVLVAGSYYFLGHIKSLLCR